ncbi:hypothetical protein D3C85_149380 [compost metagenome]
MSDTFVTDAPEAGKEPRREDTRSELREDTRRDERDSRDGDRSTRGSRDRDDRRDTPTFADMARLQARPSMGGLSDAVLSLLVNTFENAKTYDKPGVPAETKREKFKVIPMDGSLARSSQSSLLVVLPAVIGAERFALAYILLIEQSGDVQTRPLIERGETFDALVLPEDHLTETYINIVRDQAQAAVGGVARVVGNQVILADTFTHRTEKEMEQIVAHIYDNAFEAICGFRENMIDAKSGVRSSQFRVSPDKMGKGSRLEVSFDYTGKQVTDTSGLPIRSDVTTNLYYSEPNGEDNLFSRTKMGDIRCGLDLFVSYDEEGENQQRRFGGRRRRGGRDVEAPFWQAVLNINSVGSGDFPYSLELAQLLIAQSVQQSNDYRWATMLRPRSTMAEGLKPLTSLGHLFLMNPDEEAACVAKDIGPNINDNDLADYLDLTVKPDVAFGMTVPSSGEKSWVLSIYERIAIAEPGTELDDLIDLLHASADVLTGNRFSDELAKRNLGNDYRPVYTTGSRTLLGTWTDENQNRRDIREWNVPALLARVGEKNLDLVSDFQATFEDTRRSIEFNLAERYAILRKVVPGLHVVGTAEQLAFDLDYLIALQNALDGAKMSPHVSSNDGLSTRRSIGHDGYSRYATSEIGRTRRTRNDDNTDRRGRRPYSGGNYY